MKNSGDEKQSIPKWGFGMAPISAGMQARYDIAVQTSLELLDGNLPVNEVDLEHVSELKGMFNRCLRQDQWDWFSVFTDLGGPRLDDLRVLGYELGKLRQAIKSQDQEQTVRSKEVVLRANILTYLLAWQNGIENWSPGGSCGWVYILSTRQEPDILKIGMTQRTVAQRVKEINSATGVLFPYSARKVFRVNDAAMAETDIFRILTPFRLRPDREFFRIAFPEAVRLIEEYLDGSRMRQRKRGRVVWFDVGRRYGFVSCGTDENVFVHLTEVRREDAGRLLPGVEVEYDLGHRPQGLCALGVRLTETP